MSKKSKVAVCAEYGALRAFCALVNAVPYGVAMAAARGLGWAAFSLTELSPGKRLLAATGYQQASGAKLSIYGEKEPLRPGDGVRTLGRNITTMEDMGKLPYDCEGVRATIRVPAAGAVRVTPLDGNARPLGSAFQVPVVDGYAVFDISERYRTVWYAICND